MEEIDISPQNIQDAKQKATEMGRINNSITKGEGNIAGFLENHSFKLTNF